MQIKYADSTGRDRSALFKALLGASRVLPDRVMKTLWYRLLTRGAESIVWSPNAKLHGRGTLELRGGVTVRDSVRLDIHGGVLRLGSGCFINYDSIIWQEDGATLHIGDRAYIGPYCCIDGTGGLLIGAKTLIGPGVQINTSNHGMSIEEPYQDQPYTRKGVRIGSNVWIGSNVTILDGVTIGEGAIVGAGAVVSKDIPAYYLALGVPAKSKPIEKRL